MDFLVHDATGAVRPTLRSVFPDPRHAVMVVRLGGDLSIDQQGAAADRVVSLVDASHFESVHAIATGTPLLVKQINDRMRGDMVVLGVLAALAMAVVLLLVFRARWRLLSLAVMVLGVIWAFGTVGYLGIPLTMVTISGLPILIGLGVDFAVQVHSRYEDEVTRDPHTDVPDALGRTFLRLGPAVTVAALAAVVGFLTLRTSKVPMVRDFGVLLSIGTAAVFVAALVPMPAILAWRDRHHRTHARARGGRRVEQATQALATAGRRRPAGLLVVSLVIVALGPFAMGRVSVESDPERWVPQDSPVLRDLRALRRVAGSSAELGLMIEARDVLRPDVLRWMADFEARAAKRFGRQLVSVTSVASITSEITGSEPTPDDVRTVLSVAPRPSDARFSALTARARRFSSRSGPSRSTSASGSSGSWSMACTRLPACWSPRRDSPWSAPRRSRRSPRTGNRCRTSRWWPCSSGCWSRSGASGVRCWCCFPSSPRSL